MAIRRTREDKLKARMRREQGAYTWKPGKKATQPAPAKSTEVVKAIGRAKVSPAPSADEPVYFQKDIRRTFLALGIVLLLLLLAWFWLR